MYSKTNETHNTEVDLSGLMAVLSDHLYSSPDVAFRELVQNAHDSIERRRIIAGDDSTPTPKIGVVSNIKDSTVTISDNGSGLTRDEIYRFLATVGTGATRGLREETDSTELVGMFGLGFLSSFSIADRVTVTTTGMATPDETWRYESSDGFTYSVTPASPGPIGTTVELTLKTSFDEYARPDLLASTVKRYCQLLRHNISVDGERVNLRAPWRDSKATIDEFMFFASEYDPWFSPLAVMPVTPPRDEPGRLSGALWIQDGSTYGNADNRRLSVYVRGMKLIDNDRNLLPRWAGFVSGVIESDHLTPTASRESLQENADYTEAQMVLAEELVQGLVSLTKEHPAVWRKVLAHHSQALISAAVADDRLFEVLAEEIHIPTSNGPLRASHLTKDRHLHVSLGSERGFEEILFLARNIPIARGNFLGVLPFLRRYAEANSLILVEIGSDEGNSLLVDEVEIDEAAAKWLADELGDSDSQVIASRFGPDTLPLIVLPDRAAELKRRLDADEVAERAGNAMAHLARLHTANVSDDRIRKVYVNLSCPTIERLLARRHDNPAGAFQATALLRSLKTLMIASDTERGGSVDIAGAFTDTLMVIDGMLMTDPTG